MILILKYPLSTCSNLHSETFSLTSLVYKLPVSIHLHSIGDREICTKITGYQRTSLLYIIHCIQEDKVMNVLLNNKGIQCI